MGVPEPAGVRSDPWQRVGRSGAGNVASDGSAGKKRNNKGGVRPRWSCKCRLKSGNTRAGNDEK